MSHDLTRNGARHRGSTGGRLHHGLDHRGPRLTLEQIADGAGLERGEELFAVVKHRDNHADEFRPQRTQFLDGHDAGLAGEIDVAEQDLRPARRQSRQGRLGTGEVPDHLATPRSPQQISKDFAVAWVILDDGDGNHSGEGLEKHPPRQGKEAL